MPLKDRSRTHGGSQADNWIFNLIGRQRRLRDYRGRFRHYAGGRIKTNWDYMPQDPGPSILGLRSKIWTFMDPSDVVTDAVSATEYKWAETALGTGTPLAVQDVAGGGAKFTNGARDDDFYFYEQGAEAWILDGSYDLWFRAVLQVSDATQSDVWCGLSARLASGNIFDNRVDCVGFKKDDGDTNIDLETSLSSSATNENAKGTLADDTDIVLEFHYRANVPEVSFAIDNANVARITTTLPTTNMLFSFGIRNGEAVAKSMTLKTAIVALENSE